MSQKMSSDNALTASSNANGGVGDQPGGDSGSSSKVNAIWQQLKSAHGGGQKTAAVNFNKLWHGFSSDPVQGKARPAKPAPCGQGSTYQAQLIDRTTARNAPDPGPKQPQQPSPSQTQQPLAISGSAKPDPETALQLVARCVAGLKDSSQAARRKALQDVQTQLLDNPALSEQWLAERLEGDGLGKALLRRFDDPSDGCREAAVTSMLSLLRAAPQAVLSLLPYAFPVIAERVRHREEGSKNLTEPCEEVRLALARLLRSLVSLSGKSFGGYAGEAVELVAALAEDPFHEVQEEACGLVGDMNDVLGLRLQPVSKQLVAALLPLTTAKRHRVRIAALQALRPTMHQGAHEMILEMVAWRDPNVIPIKAFYGEDLKVNFCGKLASDPHPAVRREFLAVLSDWMTGLRERLDHESRLLPFVLSALNDEAPEIQADAVALLERLGIQYEQDHEKDLKDTLSYLPEEAHGIGWQAPGAAGYVYGAAAAGEETVNGGRAVFVLPGPLRNRPRLGSRRLVQSNFGRIVGALSEEVTSWLLEARRRAAALLRTQLVLAEDWSEQHLHLLLPALCKAISDPEVRPLIRDCCSVIGAFTDPELALQLMRPRVADEAAELGQRAAALEVLACVIRGAGPRRALDAHLTALLDLLLLSGGGEGESLLTSEDTRIRRALLEVVEQLVATCAPACSRHAAQLLWMCLHLRAPGHAPAVASAATAAAAGAAAAAAAPGAGLAVAAGADEAAAAAAAGPAAVEAVLMPRLAEACGFGGGVDEMVEAYRRELLAQCDPGSSPNVLLATGVLCRLILPFSSLSYLLYLPEDVLTRVLPPSTAASAASTAMELDDTAAAAAAAASGGDVAMQEQDGGAASPSGRPHWHWHGASTPAVLSHLRSDLSWLPRQPRCATLCLVSLEACLTSLPLQPTPPPPEDASAGAGADTGGGTSAGDAGMAEAETAAEAEAGEQLAAVLSLALGACQELSPPALLAALRCAHVALRRRLLAARSATAAGAGAVSDLDRRVVGELVERLAACMGVVSSAACRLQACYVLGMLVGSPDATAALLAEGGEEGRSGDGAAAAPLQAVCAAVSARLYDAADEVRCAALGLARQVVVTVVAAGTGAGTGAGGAALERVAGGAAARLVGEIAQLRDVAPGSAFYDEYHVFRGWMAQYTQPQPGP
ncbi:hypothetical protein PLESTB_000524400 [Pleodorina starrii]|uniref:Uncharacterized protein n=1 Tax=Pleodorina starrii TaxID=330485 RepID=A0A9W6F0B4_9CHLO|nr:hypothetical protein PLESTM_000387800 [Pleodorina starrii]GLC51642.1 hypothetical protein PLESTB_000524400 [Pleodorina starrii]GLC72410.1 hypothetical protein PLESTF_001244700 [Pleodorina starrii]